MSQINEVDVFYLKESLGKGEKIQLIDVREPIEYRNYHIPFSTNVPLSEILNSIKLYDDSKKIIIICKVGVRSKLACQQLISEGYKLPLFNLIGGIVAWQQAGYKVNRMKV